MLNTSILFTAICAPGISGRRGIRLLLWGKPGIGKTAQVAACTSAMGAHLITIIAALREPADFLGLPIPDGKGGVVYAAPAWAREANTRAAAGQVVVVFFDELTTCAPAVQAALLRVVNEGWVGDTQLHPNVVFLAAANPVEQAAGGYDLAPPMANRWCHIDVEDTSATTWAEGMISGWAMSQRDSASTAEVIARIEHHYPSTRAKAIGLVTGFLRANSSHMIRLPEMGDPNASKAWPSPRSWEMTIAALAGGEANGLADHEIDILVQGCVGVGVAGELRQYQSEADLPDPATLLDAEDPSKIWKLDQRRSDITRAVLNSCSALVSPKTAEKRLQRADALWGIIAEVAKPAGDCAVVAARALAQAGLVMTPKARVHLSKLSNIMMAMGELGK